VRNRDVARIAAAAVRRAAEEPGRPLEPRLRTDLERRVGGNLEMLRVHAGPSSEAAAAQLSARAYTIGSDVYLGREASRIPPSERADLLAHEATHALQQGARRVPLPHPLRIADPNAAPESDARRAGSPALAVRDALRTQSVPPQVQRDIIGKSTKAQIPLGEMKINFTKIEGAAAGDWAKERGNPGITFTPNAKAPDSTSIRFVQIVRTFDTSTGKEADFTGTTEAGRMKQFTKGSKTVTPGFYVDQSASTHAPRTAKGDATVLPYYDFHFGGPGTAPGSKAGAAITPATLWDQPATAGTVQFKFVTSAKDSIGGTYYGSVLWGFEVYQDKAGVAKIKGEYRSFRSTPGATTSAALKTFDEYYRNPGASTAP
jgi:hypothetical protein